MDLPQRLLHQLEAAADASRYWVAFSGGLDSAVLLHALAACRHALGAELTALHVDHGLNPQSSAWSAQCVSFCRDAGIRCVVERVDARPHAGESPEAAARHARYRAFSRHVGAGEVLLTAHHQDDQAETLLLQLLRGSGVGGLAAMPTSSSFGPGRLLRPFLGLPRAELVAYADSRGLSWIDDPSNFDTGYDRNFLRHKVLPILRLRWSAASRVMSRSARHLAEAAALLDILAAQDLAPSGGSGAGTLSVSKLVALEPARARNLLRYWLRQRGLPLPSTERLERILAEVLPARSDAQPLVEWAGVQVRRYRDDLFAFPPLPPVPQGRFAWTEMSLMLPEGLGQLSLTPVNQGGIKPELAGRLEVTFQNFGEKCRPVGRNHRHTLKKLLQEEGVPPWERDRLPLVYLNRELVAVADMWVCEPYLAGPAETGFTISWQRGH